MARQTKGASLPVNVKQIGDRPSTVAKGSDGTKARILAGAERLFAERGYDGATVRQIALLAKVPIALINYHFGNKDGLYRAVFELRTPTMVDQRQAGMELAEMEADPDKRLELLVKSLIAPMLKLKSTEKHSWFGRIMAREVADPKNAERKIIEEMLDPIARQFIAMLAECMPHKSEAEIQWAYHAMIGAMVFYMADYGRIARLSGNKCDPEDHRSATKHLVSFLISGCKGI